MIRRVIVASVAVIAALLLPARRPRAKVVDGDRQLWLHVNANATEDPRGRRKSHGKARNHPFAFSSHIARNSRLVKHEETERRCDGTGRDAGHDG